MPEARQVRARRTAARWIAAVLALGAAAATVIATSPAQAAGTTVDAQLSLTGVTTTGDVLGGTTIGVHPGDTVDFKASILPTAGLNNIPALQTLVTGLANLTGSLFQVVVTFPDTFPGGKQVVTLGGPTTGKCKGTQQVPVTFPAIGTYQFTWTVQYLVPTLLGCSISAVGNADLNLLKAAGVALNAANQWSGQIVVATNPPPPGISVQLPGLGLGPKVGPISIPALALPAINIPTIPVNVPSLVSNLPVIGGKSGSGSTGAPGNCVPCQVVPFPSKFPGGVGAVGPESNGLSLLGAGLHEPSVTGGDSTPTTTPTVPPINQTTTRVEYAANRAPAQQLPVLLAIVAIIALGLVTATYARLFLIRRSA
jgi:hypothetical protein